MATASVPAVVDAATQLGASETFASASAAVAQPMGSFASQLGSGAAGGAEFVSQAGAAFDMASKTFSTASTSAASAFDAAATSAAPVLGEAGKVASKAAASALEAASRIELPANLANLAGGINLPEIGIAGDVASTAASAFQTASSAFSGAAAQLSTIPNVAELGAGLTQIGSMAAGGAVPELGGVDIALSAASAVAGAATQLPRVAKLREETKTQGRELEIASSGLSQSEQTLIRRIAELENAVVLIDREYERLSRQLKLDFDETLKRELEDLDRKLREQFEYEKERTQKLARDESKLKMDVQSGIMQQKYNLEKFQYVQDYSRARKEEVKKMMKEQRELNLANKKLEGALLATRKELETLREKNKK